MGIAIGLGCSTGTDSGSSGSGPLETEAYVARSTDGGLTWSTRAALNPDGVPLLGSDANPQLTTDTQGTWVGVWHSNKLAELPGTDFDIFVARSTNGGATWMDHAELNTNADSDEKGDVWVQLTTDELGTWIAIWQSWDSLGGTIGTDADVLFARSTDTGLSWTDPAPLNTSAATDEGEDNNPQIATDGAGIWLAVWYTSEGYNRPSPPPPDDPVGPDRDILMARSTDLGLTWTDPAPLNNDAVTDAAGDSFPQVTTDGQGLWIAVWQSIDLARSTFGADSDIMFARSTDGGLTWTDPAALNTNAASKPAGQDNIPKLTTDGLGLWIAVWDSTDQLGRTIGADRDILFARSTNGGATWTDPAPLNNTAAVDGMIFDLDPQLTTDGLGSWVATWSSGNTLGDTIGSDRDILTARSTDGGLTWSDPAPLNSNAATDSGDDTAAQLTTDEQGLWVATWQATDES
jgi:hypothetical protein